jgi:hypothetical protein
MKILKTGRLFKVIKFKDKKADQVFYVEKVEVDSTEKVQTIHNCLPEELKIVGLSLVIKEQLPFHWRAKIGY